jgi:hypothetical protein
MGERAPASVHGLGARGIEACNLHSKEGANAASPLLPGLDAGEGYLKSYLDGYAAVHAQQL